MVQRVFRGGVVFPYFSGSRKGILYGNKHYSVFSARPGLGYGTLIQYSLGQILYLLCRSFAMDLFNYPLKLGQFYSAKKITTPATFAGGQSARSARMGCREKF